MQGHGRGLAVSGHLGLQQVAYSVITCGGEGWRTHNKTPTHTDMCTSRFSSSQARQKEGVKKPERTEGVVEERLAHRGDSGKERAGRVFA